MATSIVLCSPIVHYCLRSTFAGLTKLSKLFTSQFECCRKDSVLHIYHMSSTTAYAAGETIQATYVALAIHPQQINMLHPT